MTTFVGLCSICRNARVISNRRGSRFWLCALSRTDPRFPRYPRLPVLECEGHAEGRPSEAVDPAADPGEPSEPREPREPGDAQ